MLLELIEDIMLSNELKIEVMGAFIAIDMITGLIKAVINKDVKSNIMRTGLLKKVLEIIVVIVGCLLDALLGVNYIATGILVFIIAMEGISITENVGEYIPLPNFLVDLLGQLKDKGDSGNV